MGILSKFKLQTIPTSCVEYVHPWQDSCIDATVGLFFDALQDSFRIYTTVYVFTFLLRGKKPTKKAVLQTVLGILRSTAFLTTHSYGYSVCLCSLRYVLGSFDKYLVSFTPAFLSSLVAIQLERPSRRPLLCLYVTNVASETFFRMAVWRGWVRPIRHGEVAIFTLSSAILLYLFRGEHSDDSMFSMLRLVIGKAEEGKQEEIDAPLQEPPVVQEHISTSTKRTRTPSYLFISKICRFYKNLINLLKLQKKHKSCPHKYSCAHYTVEGFVKMFGLGYGIQTALTLVLSLRKIIKKPTIIPQLLVGKKSLSLGAFLGLYAGIFKSVSCILRWANDGDSQNHAIPAGLLAGCAFWFYPDTTAALYVMWKSLQVLYVRAMENGYLPHIPGGTVILYCFSTAVLFHAAILEPQNLRPSYFRFLYNLSGGRIAAMNRKPLEAFGLQSEKALVETLTKLKLNPKPVYNFKLLGNVISNY